MIDPGEGGDLQGPLGAIEGAAVNSQDRAGRFGLVDDGADATPDSGKVKHLACPRAVQLACCLVANSPTSAHPENANIALGPALVAQEQPQPPCIMLIFSPFLVEWGAAD